MFKVLTPRSSFIQEPTDCKVRSMVTLIKCNQKHTLQGESRWQCWSFPPSSPCYLIIYDWDKLQPSKIWLFGDWPCAVRYRSGVQQKSEPKWLLGHHFLGFVLLLVAPILGASHFHQAGRKNWWLDRFQHHSASPNGSRVLWLRFLNWTDQIKWNQSTKSYKIIANVHKFPQFFRC